MFLPGESHGRRSLAAYCPCDLKESDTKSITFLPILKLPRTSKQFGVNGVSDLCHLSHYLKPLICHRTVLCCASHFSRVRLCHLTSFPPSSLLSNWGQQCTSHEVARKTPRDHKCLTWPLTFTFITLLTVFYLQVVRFFTQEWRKRLQWNFLYYESFPSPLFTDTNGGKDFI